MKLIRFARAKRITSAEDRAKALSVLQKTYCDEKGWVHDVEPVFPLEDLSRDDLSWFLATVRGEPVGILRVHYNPDILAYAKYGLKPIDETFNVEAFVRNERIAEVGRFAVVKGNRKGVGIVISLMRAATRDIVAKGYTKVITDVFENEDNSPLRFHMNTFGFLPVATHEIGDLLHKGRRVTLLLDMKAGYQKIKKKGKWFFRLMTMGWTENMHRSLAA